MRHFLVIFKQNENFPLHFKIFLSNFIFSSTKRSSRRRKVTNDSLHWRYWLCVKAEIRFGNHETHSIAWFLGKWQSQKSLEHDAAMCKLCDASFEFERKEVWKNLDEIGPEAERSRTLPHRIMISSKSRGNILATSTN